MGRQPVGNRRNQFQVISGQMPPADPFISLLAVLIQRVREQRSPRPEDQQPKGFDLKSLLGQEVWGALNDDDRRDLGWEFRELVRVMSEVVYLGSDEKGDALYILRRDIEERVNFDKGPERR